MPAISREGISYAGSLGQPENSSLQGQSARIFPDWEFRHGVLCLLPFVAVFVFCRTAFYRHFHERWRRGVGGLVKEPFEFIFA